MSQPLLSSCRPPRFSRYATLACAGAAWLAATAASFALGTRVVDQNAEATARGDAFAATADNPSAVYYNPAGITQLAGTQMLLGGYGFTFRTTSSLDAKHGDTFANHQEYAAAPQFFVTSKLPGTPLTLGFGVYAPFGFHIKYPETVPFRTLGKEGGIQYIAFNSVVGIQISRTFSIGLGVSVNYGTADLRDGVFKPGDGFRFHGDSLAVGGNAGVLWQPTPMHSFGLTYFSPTQMHFSGYSLLHYSDIEVPVEVAPGVVRTVKVAPGVNRRQAASANFPFPEHLMFGYSFRPTPNWNFEADVDWTDWDSLNTVTLKQRSGNTLLPFNWRSSFMYEFGVTRRLGDWRLSLGYIYIENSVPNASFNPLIPDSARNTFAGGVGRDFGRVSVDLAYQYTYGPERTVAQGTAADGRYRFEAQALTLSLGYHF